MQKLHNKSKNILVSEKLQIADTFFSRMIGLLNRKSLSSQESLLITKCNSIHMFFMRFSIDVVFVDKNLEVVGLVNNIKPYCMSRVFFKASSAIELPAGKIFEKKIEIFDKLEII